MSDEVQLQKVEVEVTKEVYEVGLALKGLMTDLKDALKDGWQPGSDIPSVLMGSFTRLTKAVEGIDKVDDEFKAYPVKAAHSVVLPVTEGVEALLSKDESEG